MRVFVEIYKFNVLYVYNVNLYYKIIRKMLSMRYKIIFNIYK